MQARRLRRAGFGAGVRRRRARLAFPHLFRAAEQVRESQKCRINFLQNKNSFIQYQQLIK
jgi:hypothetical protein